MRAHQQIKTGLAQFEKKNASQEKFGSTEKTTQDKYLKTRGKASKKKPKGTWVP